MRSGCKMRTSEGGATKAGVTQEGGASPALTKARGCGERVGVGEGTFVGWLRIVRKSGSFALALKIRGNGRLRRRRPRPIGN